MEHNRWYFGRYADDDPVWTDAAYRMEVRAGFTGFAEWCRVSGVELQIVSNGDSRYVRPILERRGLGWIPAACFADRDALWDKLGVVGDQVVIRKKGEVIYIGDGLSDYDAAAVCGRVFARGDLAWCMAANNRPYTYFDDFHTVLAKMKELVKDRVVGNQVPGG